VRNFIFPPFVTGRGALGLALVRCVMGVAFMLHGWPKLQNLTHWAGDGLPEAVQAFAAISEFGGGILLILGLLTPLASLCLAGTMGGALNFHLSKGDAFVGGYELATVYLSIALMLLLIGPGVLSLDALLFGRRSPAPATTAPHAM
jgi:putative oxidoreductase